jgi:hypothetical protein
MSKVINGETLTPPLMDDETLTLEEKVSVSAIPVDGETLTPPLMDGETLTPRTVKRLPLPIALPFNDL